MKQSPLTHLWFHNPGQFGIRLAPERFRKELHRNHPDLEVTWNSHLERWQVFAKSPTINHPICRGWRLLFVWKDIDGGYLPLDERLFAMIATVDGQQQGDGKKYIDRIISEMHRDELKREAQRSQETIDLAMPSWHHSQISVAQFGKSNGSKFSRYHA